MEEAFHKPENEITDENIDEIILDDFNNLDKNLNL